MMSGTIIGEISIAIIARRKGTWLWDRPIAARVPTAVDKMVAAGAIRNESQGVLPVGIGEKIPIVLEGIAFRIERQHFLGEGEKVLGVK